jgi:hypothetical protein
MLTLGNFLFGNQSAAGVGGGGGGTGPIPVVRGFGTMVATNSLVASITPPLPTGTVLNDVLLLMCETNNGESVTAPTGYQAVTGSPQDAVDTRLHLFWKRAGSSEAAPTVNRTGDHLVGVICGVAGCVTTGNPIHAAVFGNNATGGSHTVSGFTTTKNNCLILDIAAAGLDANTSTFGGWANSSLPYIYEIYDLFNSAGGGGGVGVSNGGMQVAGLVGSTTMGNGGYATAVAKIALVSNDDVGQSLDSTIAAMFAVGGTEGFAFDPYILGSLRQNSNMTGPVAAHADPVGAILDLSGNSNHASIATAGRPLLDITSGVNSLLFDGATSGAYFTFPSGMLTGWTSGMFLFGAKNANEPVVVEASSSGLLCQTGTSTTSEHYPWSGNQNIYGSFLSSAHKQFNPTPSLGVWHQGDFRSASGAWGFAMDGTDIYTTGTNTVSPQTNPFLGKHQNNRGDGGIFYHGRMGRMLLFNRVLTGTELTNARAWIADGY